jgi:hypothetical protein
MGQSVCRALTADSTATRNIQGAERKKSRGSDAPALGLMDSLLRYVTSWQPPPVVFSVVKPLWVTQAPSSE